MEKKSYKHEGKNYLEKMVQWKQRRSPGPGWRPELRTDPGLPVSDILLIKEKSSFISLSCQQFNFLFCLFIQQIHLQIIQALTSVLPGTQFLDFMKKVLSKLKAVMKGTIFSSPHSPSAHKTGTDILWKYWEIL